MARQSGRYSCYGPIASRRFSATPRCRFIANSCLDIGQLVVGGAIYRGRPASRLAWTSFGCSAGVPGVRGQFDCGRGQQVIGYDLPSRKLASRWRNRWIAGLSLASPPLTRVSMLPLDALLSKLRCKRATTARRAVPWEPWRVQRARQLAPAPPPFKSTRWHFGTTPQAKKGHHWSPCERAQNHVSMAGHSHVQHTA